MHDEFKTQALTRLQEEYPDAAILVHPESPQAIVDMADAVGSTHQLIAAAKTLPHQRLIVEPMGHFLQMQQAVPDKELLEAPTAGEGQPAAAARIVRDGHEWPSVDRRGIRTGRKRSQGTC